MAPKGKKFQREVKKNYKNAIKLIYKQPGSGRQTTTSVPIKSPEVSVTPVGNSQFLEEDCQVLEEILTPAQDTAPTVPEYLFHSSSATSSSDGSIPSNTFNFSSGKDSVSYVTTNIVDATNITEGLRNWALRHSITHAATSDLLKILKRHTCFSPLPNDARTLMKTPRYSTVKDVSPGHYIAFDWKEKIRKFCRQRPNQAARLQVNIDGIQIFNSSNKSFWPILGAIKGTEEVFTIGVWLGPGKPSRVNEYLEDFVNEFNVLCDELGNEKLQISAFICDAPARSFISGVKNHTGYFGCSKCTTKGQYLDNRICFPATNEPLRTDQSFRCENQPLHHNEMTTLRNLPMDMVADIPYEYMHLIVLGVTRKLLYLWTSAKKSPVRLSRHLQDKLNARLLEVSKYTPCDFVRRARSVTELDHWKATELRQFLLYTGPVVLKNILPNCQFQNFLCLSVATRLLLGESTHREFNEYAHNLFVYFVQCFGKIYGTKYISYNVHGLVHVAADALIHGNLDSYSGFKFENHLQKLKKLVRSPFHALQQVHNRIVELDNMSLDVPQIGFQKVRDVGSHLNDKTGEKDFKQFKSKNFLVKLSRGNNCVRLVSGEVGIIDSFVKDKLQEKVRIRLFSNRSDYFDHPCLSSSVGVQTVSSLGSIIEKRVEEITSKVYLVPVDGEVIAVTIVHTE